MSAPNENRPDAFPAQLIVPVASTRSGKQSLFESFSKLKKDDIVSLLILKEERQSAADWLHRRGLKHTELSEPIQIG
jgi:hypothetical protein